MIHQALVSAHLCVYVHVLCVTLQVAGKSLPDSGLLGLSGLKLLWVSRKGHLLYKTAPEEPRRRLTAWHRLTRAAAPNKKGKGHGSDHSLPAAQSGAGALHHHAAAAAGNGSAAADHVHDSHETHASHPTYLTVTIEDEGIGAPADVILQVRCAYVCAYTVHVCGWVCLCDYSCQLHCQYLLQACGPNVTCMS